MNKVTLSLANGERLVVKVKTPTIAALQNEIEDELAYQPVCYDLIRNGERVKRIQDGDVIQLVIHPVSEKWRVEDVARNGRIRSVKYCLENLKCSFPVMIHEENIAEAFAGVGLNPDHLEIFPDKRFNGEWIEDLFHGDAFSFMFSLVRQIDLYTNRDYFMVMEVKNAMRAVELCAEAPRRKSKLDSFLFSILTGSAIFDWSEVYNGIDEAQVLDLVVTEKWLVEHLIDDLNARIIPDGGDSDSVKLLALVEALQSFH